MQSTEAIKYMTVIRTAREVSLWGKADAAPWQAYLQAEGESPEVNDGKVSLLISTVDSKYMGLRFQELSVSVQLSTDRYFLAHAFNSIPAFAWSERRFFRTPYYAAKTTVAEKQIVLRRGSEPLLRATLEENAPCLQDSPEDWRLILRLPRKFRKQAGVPHYFYARLQGETRHYPGTACALQLTPRADDVVFILLVESRFAVQEWHVRANATHSKSKTYFGPEGQTLGKST